MIAIRNTQQYAVQDTHTNTNTEMQVNLTGSGHLAQAPTTGSDDHCALALTHLLLSGVIRFAARIQPHEVYA